MRLIRISSSSPSLPILHLRIRSRASTIPVDCLLKHDGMLHTSPSHRYPHTLLPPIFAEEYDGLTHQNNKKFQLTHSVITLRSRAGEDEMMMLLKGWCKKRSTHWNDAETNRQTEPRPRLPKQSASLRPATVLVLERRRRGRGFYSQTAQRPTVPRQHSWAYTLRYRRRPSYGQRAFRNLWRMRPSVRRKMIEFARAEKKRRERRGGKSGEPAISDVLH